MDVTAAGVAVFIVTSDLKAEEFCHEEYKWIVPPQSPLQLAMLVVIAFWCLWTLGPVTLTSSMRSI